MSQQYTVTEFIKLTPVQKERLMKRDPEQYKKLCQEMESKFSKESDPSLARYLK